MKRYHYRTPAQKKHPPETWGAVRDLFLILGGLYFIGRAIASFLGY